MTAQSTRKRALNMLMDAGTWVTRGDLSALSTCTPAVDDAMADLVVEGLVEHRENVGYRMAGSALSRRAMQILMRERAKNPRQNRCMTRNYFHEDQVRIGFARVEQLQGEETVIAYELTLDKAAVCGESVNEQAANLMAIADKFYMTRGGANEQPGV